ncbi:MAG: MFS transporter [Ktedonobacterales bacterium]
MDVTVEPEQTPEPPVATTRDGEVILLSLTPVAEPTPPQASQQSQPAAQQADERQVEAAPITAPLEPLVAQAPPVTPAPASRPLWRTLPPVVIKRRRGAQIVLLGALTLDTLLYGLVVPFLPGRALALGASPALVGVLFGAYGAGLLVGTPPAGWLTDHIGARRILLLGLVALLGATLLFAFANDIPTYLAWTSGLWLLFAARATQGIAAAITWTASLALIAQLYPERRAALFARVGLASGVGTLLGPPLGGALYTLGGFRAPFLFVAALALLDGVGRVFFVPGKRVLLPARPEPKAGRMLYGSVVFVVALIATAVGDISFTALEPTLPPLLTSRFGLTPLLIGLLFGALIVCFTLAQLLTGLLVKRARPALVMTVGLALGAIALYLLGHVITLAHMLLVLMLLCSALAFVLLPALQLLTDVGEARSPAQNVPYGAIYAAYNLAFAVGGLLGPLIATGMITLFGIHTGFTLLGLLLVTVAFWLAWLLPRIPRYAPIELVNEATQ